MPLESIRPSTLFRSTLMPWARAHVGVGAGGADAAAHLGAEEPVEQGDDHGGEDQGHENGVLKAELLARYRRETSRSYLSGLMAWLALPPMMRRFMEKSASWVRIPARIAGMPHDRVEQAGDEPRRSCPR